MIEQAEHFVEVVSALPDPPRFGATERARRSSTRERILVEASMLFARKGYTATTTREIANRVRIRQPSLFHHFSSKSKIMDELLDHSLTHPTYVAEFLAQAKGPTAPRLYACIHFDAKYVLTSPYSLAGLDNDEVMDSPLFLRWRELRARLHEARK
ncbi:MAG: TetR/AcrR family transcriptional regulator, partial [Gaiellaceae bacterium]